MPTRMRAWHASPGGRLKPLVGGWGVHRRSRRLSSMHAAFGSCGQGNEHGGDAGCPGLRKDHLGFIGWKIRDQHRIDAGVGRLGVELGRVVVTHQIGVDQEPDRQLRMLIPDLTNHSPAIGLADSRCQGAAGGSLEHGGNPDPEVNFTSDSNFGSSDYGSIPMQRQLRVAFNFNF